MTYYIHIENNKIISSGEFPMGEGFQSIEVSEEIYNNYKADPDRYIWNGTEIIENPDYEAEKQAKERARLNELFMTRSDFFDATIMAFGADENDLLAIISSVLGNLPLSDIEKKIALNNYKNALNFYRKHTLFTLLSNVEIPISEQQTIKITSEQWDRFFDTKDYRELLSEEE